MPAILETLTHRPYPLPPGRWRLTQRWNDLLFAHWPIPAAALAPLLPAGLEPDLFDGQAWFGVVPFWMDRVRTRAIRDTTFAVPTTSSFPELNLRTYVRSRGTGLPGVFFFSLDCASPLAVAGARTLFHLPYFLAAMHRRTTSAGVEYISRRLLTRTPARFEATYRGLRVPAPRNALTHFLTERYALFTPHRGSLLAGHIHHLPWPLEEAEAEIRVNEIPSAHGITLPNQPPILHFARTLEVFLWSLTPHDAQLSPPTVR